MMHDQENPGDQAPTNTLAEAIINAMNGASERSEEEVTRRELAATYNQFFGNFTNIHIADNNISNNTGAVLSHLDATNNTTVQKQEDIMPVRKLGSSPTDQIRQALEKETLRTQLDKLVNITPEEIRRETGMFQAVVDAYHMLSDVVRGLDAPHRLFFLQRFA